VSSVRRIEEGLVAATVDSLPQPSFAPGNGKRFQRFHVHHVVGPLALDRLAVRIDAGA
jgi:hypothetical protein